MIRTITKHLFLFLYFLVRIACEVHQKDYCLLDKFNPDCGEDKVILIQSATYGRLKINSCISRGTGLAGCFVDVKDILEGFCSGRKSCTLLLTDHRLLATRPCGNNFDLYITISYICLPATTVQKQCDGPVQTPVTANSGFLSSAGIEQRTHSGDQCSWKISSVGGERLNVTIQRFSASSEEGEPPVCHSAATITEASNAVKVLLCPSDPRNKSVFLSQSSEIQVAFPQAQENAVYLIHFQATGCKKPKIPEDAHFERQGDKVTVTCKEGRGSWELTCKDNEWQGEEKSCNKGWAFASSMNEEDTPPLGMLLIVVTGIALGVLIGGFLLYLAINAFKRYHGLLPSQQIQNPSYEKPLYNPNNKLGCYNDRTIQRSSMIYGTNRGSYPHHQMPPPVPPPHADTAQMSPPPSEMSQSNRQSHIYETPLFNSL